MEFLGDACILSFGAFSLFLLVRIFKHGKLLLVEPNRRILVLEILTAIAILGVAVERLVDDLI